MMSDVRGYGCGCAPGVGAFSGFGQADDGTPSTALVPAAESGAISLGSLFLVSVGAGVTVYLITLFLPHRR